MNELKPCPFHKPNPDSGISWCDDDDDYWCECAACGAQGPYGTSPEHAAELWDCRLDAEQEAEPEIDEAALKRLWERGKEAWKNIGPSASAWVDAMRGNSPAPELEEALEVMIPLVKGLLSRAYSVTEISMLLEDAVAFLRRVGRLT